jgi:hypothetical protein
VARTFVAGPAVFNAVTFVPNDRVSKHATATTKLHRIISDVCKTIN